MNQALILVDIQNDYFPGGSMELVGMDTAAENARAVLDAFRADDDPIFHIQHLALKPDATFFVPGTAGAKHNGIVAPIGDESVIQKNFPNSFRGTALESGLRRCGAEELVIVGAMSHMCIDATTRAAFDLGFQCAVVEDACATRDLVFKDKTINAEDVHGSLMAALSAPYAEVESTEKFLYLKRSDDILHAPSE
jgi:nicotinamidase-related amidase